jgi:cytoskeletal protein CcmA (bactofilin family)
MRSQGVSMFGNKSPASAKEIGSLIGVGTTLVGDITFSGGLRIDGTVRGAVRCTEGEKGGMLVISEHGRIEGEVRAAHLVVAGSIAGPVFASELVELQPKARLAGDLHYRALEMHHGAIVDGRLVHQSEEARGTAGSLKLAHPTAKLEPVLESKAEMKTESKAG